jgi:hypothetical protein
MRRIAVKTLAAALALLSACASDNHVAVSNGTVTVDGKFWRPMENPEGFAENVEAREKRPGEVYRQVLTIFKAPIGLTWHAADSGRDLGRATADASR